MKTKIIQFIPALVAILFIGFDYFSTWCIFTFGVCYGTTISHISLSITQPLYFFALYSLPLVIILAFIQRIIFNSWLKFALWALPLLFIFVASQPVVSGMFSTDRNDAVQLAGEVFSGISLVLIIYKSIVFHRKSEQS